MAHPSIRRFFFPQKPLEPILLSSFAGESSIKQEDAYGDQKENPLLRRNSPNFSTYTLFPASIENKSIWDTISPTHAKCLYKILSTYSNCIVGFLVMVFISCFIIGSHYDPPDWVNWVCLVLAVPVAFIEIALIGSTHISIIKLMLMDFQSFYLLGNIIVLDISVAALLGLTESYDIIYGLFAAISQAFFILFIDAVPRTIIGSGRVLIYLVSAYYTIDSFFGVFFDLPGMYYHDHLIYIYGTPLHVSTVSQFCRANILFYLLKYVYCSFLYPNSLCTIGTRVFFDEAKRGSFGSDDASRGNDEKIKQIIGNVEHQRNMTGDESTVISFSTVNYSYDEAYFKIPKNYIQIPCESFEPGYSFSAVSFMSDTIPSIYQSKNKESPKSIGYRDTTPECASPLIVKNSRTKKEEEAVKQLLKNRTDSFNCYLTDEEVTEKVKVLDFSYLSNGMLSLDSQSSYEESDTFSIPNIHSFPQQTPNLFEDNVSRERYISNNDAILVSRARKHKLNSASPEQQYKSHGSFNEIFQTM